MVYLLKFGASWVLPPGVFIVAFFALAWYAWRRRGERRLAAMIAGMTFVFYLLCTGFVAEKTLGALESVYTPPVDPQGDVIIMLGGGAMPDSPDVDGVGALCADPANRLLTAVRLQRKLDIPILLSGGQVYEDTGAEAKIAKRMLMSLGVPEDKIFVETKSINTTQNAKFSAEILREQGFSYPLLVTSAFHMKRAVLNFEKQGIAVTPYPADYQVTHHPVFHYTKLRPQTEALLNNVTVLQESLRTLVTKYIE
ncbi:MAG: YdcF family protein [Selenomonadaceae bacterium]|nr:YdcF family protein [Selenomonadaceae bacterium]